MELIKSDQSGFQMQTCQLMSVQRRTWHPRFDLPQVAFHLQPWHGRPMLTSMILRSALAGISGTGISWQPDCDICCNSPWSFFMRSGGKATDFGVLRIANKRPSLVVALNTAAAESTTHGSGIENCYVVSKRHGMRNNLGLKQHSHANLNLRNLASCE